MKKTILILLSTLATTYALADAPAKPLLGGDAPTLKAVTNGILIKNTDPVAAFDSDIATNVVVSVSQSTPSGIGLANSDTVTVTCNSKPHKVVAGGMYACFMANTSPSLMLQIKPENFLNGATVNISVVENK